ncbi:MAG TPA: flagellar basal-body MS-ring/collar protein FliF [Solirubrobacteraceae bacterium]|jgi:flagellar M-ring protein FliF|nr:flagellar basal-body MS-ring/collar protein FliF [Solirubrobacteraceae bacterium]
MASFSQTIKRLSPKGWAIVGGSVAAGLVFLVVLMQMASAPSYATLETGLDPSQTGKITSTLSTQGIAYQLQNNGTALAVQSDKTAQARVALATAGLLGTSQPGFSLMDKQQLGQSNFQQQVTYERALEGQLASTIETIDGVSSAQVNLVLPNAQDQLFADQQQPSTASVLLSGSSTLQSSSVRGIAQLVSSSVPGLQPGKVTITGSDGSLLWPTGNGSGDSGGLPAQQAADQRYDTATAASVNAMLAQTLGAGKAQVTVNGDVNANQATAQSLVYAKKGVPLTQQKTVETLKGAGAGAGAGGKSGTSGNIPSYAAAAGASGANSNYKNQTTNTQFGVNKTITHSVIAPGAVKRQAVSVLIDKSVPPSAIPAIKSAVANAVGLQPKRGDAISVAQLAFAPAKATPVAAAPSSMMKYAKYGVIGLASLLFLAFAGRMLRRREREPFAGQPTWLRELEAPRTLASLEQAHVTEVAALQPAVNVARRQVEDLVQRDPERVAAQVRAWMAED